MIKGVRGVLMGMSGCLCCRREHKAVERKIVRTEGSEEEEGDEERERGQTWFGLAGGIDTSVLIDILETVVLIGIVFLLFLLFLRFLLLLLMLLMLLLVATTTTIATAIATTITIVIVITIPTTVVVAMM